MRKPFYLMGVKANGIEAPITPAYEGDPSPDGHDEPGRGARGRTHQPDYLSNSRYLAPAPVL